MKNLFTAMLVNSVAFMWSSSKNKLSARFCNTPDPTESEYKATV